MTFQPLSRVIGRNMALLAVAAAVTFTAGAEAADFKIKISSPTIRSPLEYWAEQFKKGIEPRSKGRVEVGIFPGSQLGSLMRMGEALQLGTIEIVQTPPAFLSGVDPRYGIFAAPGIFKDMAHGNRVLNDPEFKKAFWPIGEPKGIKTLAFLCEAPSDYATREPIRKLSDFKGKKIRIFASPLERETMRRLGAAGIPMGLGEVLPAIQRRTIDGNKAGISVFVPFKYQNTAKYVLVAKESLICVIKTASKVWFDKLPGDIKTMVVEEAANAAKKSASYSIDFIKKMYGIWTKNGGVLTELSDAEHKKMISMLRTVGEDVFKDKPQVLKMYKLMKKVAARVAN